MPLKNRIKEKKVSKQILKIRHAFFFPSGFCLLQDTGIETNPVAILFLCCMTICNLNSQLLPHPGHRNA